MAEHFRKMSDNSLCLRTEVLGASRCLSEACNVGVIARLRGPETEIAAMGQLTAPSLLSLPSAACPKVTKSTRCMTAKPNSIRNTFQGEP
jgi:hypothetical protein